MDSSDTIKKVKFPMLADPARRVTKAYWTLIEKEGLSLRATYIIDPDGTIKTFEFHDNSIGRSAKELIRKLEAVRFVRENGESNVCPASWEPGKETLKPGLEMIGKI